MAGHARESIPIMQCITHFEILFLINRIMKRRYTSQSSSKSKLIRILPHGRRVKNSGCRRRLLPQNVFGPAGWSSAKMAPQAARLTNVLISVDAIWQFSALCWGSPSCLYRSRRLLLRTVLVADGLAWQSYWVLAAFLFLKSSAGNALLPPWSMLAYWFRYFPFVLFTANRRFCV